MSWQTSSDSLYLVFSLFLPHHSPDALDHVGVMIREPFARTRTCNRQALPIITAPYWAATMMPKSINYQWFLHAAHQQLAG